MPAVGTTHHVKLGTQYLTLRPGSYVKKPAPQFGARFTSGDPDFNSLSIWQHWAQRCWIGGMDAEDWVDDSMFDESVGMATFNHEHMTLARDLKKGSGAGWTPAGDAASVPRKFIVYNGILHCLNIVPSAQGSLIKYDVSTNTWAAAGAAFGATFRVKCIAAFDGKLFIGGIDGATPRLYYSTGALAAWTLHTNPTGVTEAITAMRTFGGKFYVAYGKQVWRAKDDQTWDGNTVFYQAGMNSDSNYITTMEPHLGFLYMLSQNGHIHRTDGNNTFDIWSWDGGTYGIALRSYDGKLFVSTYEYVDTTAVGWGVLYQFTGSAVTELKRWGKVDQATTLGGLIVHDRRLFYGASNLFGIESGFGVAVYDAVEDGHSIFASDQDTATYAVSGTGGQSNLVDDVIYYAGKIFCSVRTHGIFYTEYQFRGGSVSTMTTVAHRSSYDIGGGWLTTSTYDAGTPGLDKLWRRIVLDARIPVAAGTITVSYSVDGGVSYTALTALAYSDGLRKNYTLHLDATASSFKLKFAMTTPSASSSPIIWGFNVSYLPLPEPNWMWDFTAVIAEKIVLQDGTEETVDTEAVMDYFSDLWRTQSLTTFTDIDGTIWSTGGEAGVLVYDMVLSIRDFTRPYEGEIRFTLLEAAESY